MSLFIFLILSVFSFSSYAVSYCDGTAKTRACYTMDNTSWISTDYNSWPYLCDPKSHTDVAVSPDGDIVFPSANAGAQVHFTYTPRTAGAVTVMCEYVSGVPSSALMQRMEGGQVFTLLTKNFYTVEDGWILLNDKVKMKVTGNRCAGSCSGNEPVDLADMDGDVLSKLNSTILILPSDFSLYLWGEVTLELRKDVYDGNLGLDGLELYDVGVLYDEFTTSTAPATKSNTSYTVILTDTEVVIPNNCVINDDSDFNIDFGLVQNNKIDTEGINYNRPLHIRYNCKSPISTDVIVRFIGETSSSSSDYFATSNSNIDIKIENSDGSLIKPNSEVASELVSGAGSDDFTVSLVAPSSDVSIATGEFEASLIVDMSIP